MAPTSPFAWMLQHGLPFDATLVITSEGAAEEQRPVHAVVLASQSDYFQRQVLRQDRVLRVALPCTSNHAALSNVRRAPRSVIYF